jgi:hypothetical protein
VVGGLVGAGVDGRGHRTSLLPGKHCKGACVGCGHLRSAANIGKNSTLSHVVL